MLNLYKMKAKMINCLHHVQLS